MHACFWGLCSFLCVDNGENTQQNGGGVQILGNQSFIGSGVAFDTVFPEKIIIEDHAHITTGCIFLTHYLDTSREGIHWKAGEIRIGEGSFIGARTIIAKPLAIGKNVIVGAGSVVTKNIPSNEIWAGNPARFIRKREL